MASQFPIPEPTTTCQVIPKEQLLRQYQILGDVLNAGTLLIDVRRTDYEGGTIRGSLNMPAQSFPYNMSTLFRLCQGDGLSVISRVVFYCGSSNGRGPRCAGWFAEYVATRCAELGVPVSPDVFILEGGIKGWVAGGEQYTVNMDAYQPNYWRQLAHTESGQGNGTGRKRVAEVPSAYQGPVGVQLDERMMDGAKKNNLGEIVPQEDMMMA